MAISKKKKELFRSMLEFEKRYFPKSVKKRMTERPTDERRLGIILADESLTRIEKQLSG